MKSHLVVVFLRGLQDSESAVKTTNGTDIIIEKVDKLAIEISKVRLERLYESTHLVVTTWHYGFWRLARGNEWPLGHIQLAVLRHAHIVMISVIRLILNGTLNERLRDKNSKKCSYEIWHWKMTVFSLKLTSREPVPCAFTFIDWFCCWRGEDIWRV